MNVNLIFGSILSVFNNIATFVKSEHPELEIRQTRFLTFDGNWIWNRNGIFYVPIYGNLKVGKEEDPINALLHGKGVLKRDYPNGIHCKKIVNSFKKSGKTLREFIYFTTLERQYADYVSHIEFLDSDTFETVILS